MEWIESNVVGEIYADFMLYFMERTYVGHRCPVCGVGALIVYSALSICT